MQIFSFYRYPILLVEKQDKSINNFAFPFGVSFPLEIYTGSLKPCQGRFSQRRTLRAWEWEEAQKTSWFFSLLGIIICLGWKINLGKFYPESWNKFLFRRFLLSPGRKMASVAVDPQLVWILKCYFLISFPFCVFWEVNSSPHLGFRVWCLGWPTYPWLAPRMTLSPRLTSLRRISIPAWSLYVRLRRRAWRPSPLWLWWVLCPSSRS